MTNSEKSFYDDFSRKLLRDYAQGNPRLEAAVTHALGWMPPDLHNFLDVGCGIGWSTSEIKRAFPAAGAWGLDLSSKNIATARNLFGDAGINFVAADLAGKPAVPDTKFDALVMLDVYEHISPSDRSRVHHLLAGLLSERGVVVLTFPSKSHQEYLAACLPDGLQPVDEIVSREDLETLARDLDCRVSDCHEVSIFRPRDYVHAVLVRKAVPAGRPLPAPAQPRLESREERGERVRFQLGLRLAANGHLLAEKSGAPVIGMIIPEANVYSETFIRDQAERLPARIRMLAGGTFPSFRDDGRNVYSPLPFPNRLLNFRHRTPFKQICHLTLRRYLRREGVQLILAQYGPTAVEVMDLCRESGLPLVVHFHGFDAYRKPTLEKYAEGYRRLFAAAAAVIAVSRDMEQQLQRLGAPKAKVHFNPYGVDTQLFAAADPGKNPPVFVAVGRFVDKKGPYLTLLAFERMRRECPEARLVMAGDGPLLVSCMQMARALKIEPAVSFPGVCRHGEVARLFQQARAFVQHSVIPASGDSEGTPVALLEAGASGLPAVVTAHGGIKDVIVDGENGFLVAENDMEKMAGAMLNLAGDPELARKMGEKARTRICNDYSIEQSINRLFQILSQCL